MSWSKVKKGKKPVMWWFHKVMCEIGWLIRNKDDQSMYYHHLNKCVSYGFNLYGDPIFKPETYECDCGFVGTKDKLYFRDSYIGITASFECPVCYSELIRVSKYGKSNLPKAVNVIDNIKEGEKLNEN